MGSIALFDTIHGSTILFQLTFTFIYNNFSKFFSFSKISGSQTDLNNLVIPFQLTFIFIYNTFNKNFSFSKKCVYSRFGYSICTFAFSVCAFCLLFFFLVSRVFWLSVNIVHTSVLFNNLLIKISPTILYIGVVWIQRHTHVLLKSAFSLFFFKPAFVNFFTVNSISVHCLRTHKLHFSVTFSLKMDTTVLFTHLKIISFQYFQFQFLVSV